MPRPKPLVRRFGQVDFDSMIDIGAANDADILVCRRGAFGSNRTVTRAAIIAGAGGVPDPLLLNDGSAADPTYSFSGQTNLGMFRLGSNQLAFAANGIAQFVINPTELTAVVAGGPLLRNFDSTATIPNIITDSGDVNTGWGSAGPDILSGIAGGVEIARLVEVVGSNQLIVAPGLIDNDPTAPSLAFDGGDIGFYVNFANTLSVAVAGVRRYAFGIGAFQSVIANSFALQNEASTSANPTLIPNLGSNASGVGGVAGQVALIASGVDCIKVAEAAGARQIGFYVTAPISLQTGVAVTDAAIHAALVNLGLITA